MMFATIKAAEDLVAQTGRWKGAKGAGCLTIRETSINDAGRAYFELVPN